jgi:methanogenic corrinoid protein MtbC1
MQDMSAVVEPPDPSSAGGTGRLGYRRYWWALYRRDVAGAERVVEQCLARWTPQRIYLRLFEPALGFSGTLWAQGRISHHDEHFVTYHTLRFLRRVRRRFLPAAPPTGPLALATGVGQESHLIGLRMVSDFLQRDNWRIHWLPSNDRATVRQTTRSLRPAAVLMSVGLEAGIEPARRLIADLRRNDFPGLVVVGGRAINGDPTLLPHLGADLTAPNGLALSRLLRKVPNPTPAATASPTVAGPAAPG